MASLHLVLDTGNKMAWDPTRTPRGIYHATLDVGELEFMESEIERVAVVLAKLLIGETAGEMTAMTLHVAPDITHGSSST